MGVVGRSINVYTISSPHNRKEGLHSSLGGVVGEIWACIGHFYLCVPPILYCDYNYRLFNSDNSKLHFIPLE